MIRFTIARSASFAAFLGAGVVVAGAACSSSTGTTNGQNPGNQNSGSSGSVGNNSGSSGSISSSGVTGSNGGSNVVANGNSSGGVSGTGSGSSGGTKQSSSSSGTSGGTGSSGGSSSGSGGTDGGGMGGGDGASSGDGGNGGNCMSADLTPCTSFTAPTGQLIQLGPYGAQMDVNVGMGFENTVNSNDSDTSQAYCQSFVQSFGEDPNLSQKLLQTSMNGITINFALYTVYHPVTWPSTPVPIITWGNGTCAQPEGYGALLRYVASYGYFVVAANSRFVGSGTEQMHAIDYAAATNMDSSSPYHGRLDLSKVGAAGHSQGGASTVSAANMDSRILYAIIFNASDSGVNKPYLAISGDQDITGFTSSGMASAIMSASVPAAYMYYYNPAGMGPLRGHLPLMLSPERVDQQTVAWFDMWLRSDATAKADFVGSTCGFCGHGSDATNAYDYGANSMIK
jgi:hypothetical protein